MIYPALTVLADRIGETGLNVIVGSLRFHQVTIPTPSVIIAPIEFKTNKTGLQYETVTEIYEVVVCVSVRQANPFSDLIAKTLLVMEKLSLWLPPNWNEKVSIKSLEVTSIRFDTHPEAEDLGVVCGSLEVVIVYHAV